MFYSTRHITTFQYKNPIAESVMEARMKPRTEGTQRCLSFKLWLKPTAQVMSYQEYPGNTVHHFNIPGQHTQLRIIAEALIEIQPMPLLPQALADSTWAEFDHVIAHGDYWEALVASQFTAPTPLLHQFAAEYGIKRSGDPLTTLRQLNSTLYEAIEYVPQSTTVDSPIDEALQQRRGVCQDYSHIMIALVRDMGIPCRYVSGYLYHEKEDRSDVDASHAWVEAFLPTLGWVGFDPTNNLIAGERHIRVAVGRDYADVPPTRGIFKGENASKLTVAVQVDLVEQPVYEEEPPDPPTADWSSFDTEADQQQLLLLQQIQQQQQQQQ